MRRTVSALLLIVFAGVCAVAESSISPIDTGRQLVETFYEDDMESLWSVMNTDMREALGSIEGLQQFRDQIGISFGAETSVVSEDVSEIPEHGVFVYSRVARFEYAPVPVVVSFSFDINGTVAAFFVKPQQPS